MNKNVLAVFAAVCGLAMVSCDTPKDQRPGEKVSVDFVQPGTRNTHNIGNVNEVHGASHEQEVLPNHDPGANEMLHQGDSIREGAETNKVEGADHHEAVEH
ncbi:hypothetical protein [Botryobacter ruber]|uniref:hypothetical protein n=1 Tax=Botryobacter ruber TaxID=2171629 RepID=UPI000E0AF3DB|nr:hypothetical protein [Botryobacter ruber]